MLLVLHCIPSLLNLENQMTIGGQCDRGVPPPLLSHVSMRGADSKWLLGAECGTRLLAGVFNY